MIQTSNFKQKKRSLSLSSDFQSCEKGVNSHKVKVRYVIQDVDDEKSSVCNEIEVTKIDVNGQDYFLLRDFEPFWFDDSFCDIEGLESFILFVNGIDFEYIELEGLIEILNRYTKHTIQERKIKVHYAYEEEDASKYIEELFINNDTIILNGEIQIGQYLWESYTQQVENNKLVWDGDDQVVQGTIFEAASGIKVKTFSRVNKYNINNQSILRDDYYNDYHMIEKDFIKMIEKYAQDYTNSTGKWVYIEYKYNRSLRWADSSGILPTEKTKVFQPQSEITIGK